MSAYLATLPSHMDEVAGDLGPSADDDVIRAALLHDHRTRRSRPYRLAREYFARRREASR